MLRCAPVLTSPVGAREDGPTEHREELVSLQRARPRAEAVNGMTPADLRGHRPQRGPHRAELRHGVKRAARCQEPVHRAQVGRDHAQPG